MTITTDLEATLRLLTAAQRRDLLNTYQRKGAGLLCLITGRHLLAHGLVERVPIPKCYRCTGHHVEGHIDRNAGGVIAALRERKMKSPLLHISVVRGLSCAS